jgi:hypothetical protein
MRCSLSSPPPPPNPQFRLARVARTGGPLQLVEGREDDSDEGPLGDTYSASMSGDSKCHIFTFSYLLLGNEPISGSRFSIL